MVFVCRTAYHVGVCIVVDCLHTLFLCLAPLLGSLYTAAQHAAYLLHNGTVGFGSLYLILTNGIIGRCHIFVVGIFLHHASVQIFLGLLDAVAQCLFFGFAVGDVLGKLVGKQQTAVLQSSFIGHGLVIAAHAVQCLGNALLDVGLWQGSGFPYHLCNGLSVWVKLPLHLDASCIYTATTGGEQSAEHICTHAQLVIYHNVHNLGHLVAGVLLAVGVVHCREYALGLVLAQIIEQSVVKQHLGKVGDALHGRKVILSLTCHRLTQFVQVAANGFHRLLLGLPVVGIGLARCNLHLRNGLVKSHVAIAELHAPIGVGLWTMVVLCKSCLVVILASIKQIRNTFYNGTQCSRRCFANILFEVNILVCKLPIFCMKSVRTSFRLDNNAFDRLITDICCVDVMVAHSDSKHLAIGRFK